VREILRVSASFSIVIPTYRRAALLERTLPSYLSTEATEIVVVDDASGGPNGLVLARLASLDPRIALVTLDRHVGLPSARNEGVARARGEWVVFGEDDVWFPRTYPATLIAHAVEAGASIAGGRVLLVHPSGLDRPVEALEATIRDAVVTGHPPDRFLRAPWPVRQLPNGDVRTPLLAATSAVHRSVFERVRFDPAFRGNAFREETDFFLSCGEAGIASIHCPHAWCGHLKAHTRATRGGSWTMSRPRYALQMAANNWRLVRKHRDLLEEVRRGAGRPAGPIIMQGEFLLSMLQRLRPARP
jgi:glycosyltransferase involved in cell wall biosynthesis